MSADRYAVLVVLEGRVLTLEQVVVDALVSEEVAGRLLEELVRDSLVSSVRWLSGESQYELTRTGQGAARALIKAADYSGDNLHERVKQVRRSIAPGSPPPMRRSPGARRRLRQPIGKVRRVQQPAGKLRPSGLRLTGQDRSVRSAAPAVPATPGSAAPAVPAPAGTRDGSPAPRRSTALGLVVAGLSAPIFVSGLAFFRGPFNVADTVFGLIFTISPLIGTYVTWSRSRRR
ncbi:hypothetical protein OHA70_08845 [Kribbella sp. NBC_00382]|uniref:hypothetical protein n=1 Tax=Kribbella sp. NBC_00382 TaxID=2975967 RepID=UPI002E234D6C